MKYESVKNAKEKRKRKTQKKNAKTFKQTICIKDQHVQNDCYELGSRAIKHSPPCNSNSIKSKDQEHRNISYTQLTASQIYNKVSCQMYS